MIYLFMRGFSINRPTAIFNDVAWRTLSGLLIFPGKFYCESFSAEKSN
jgi:hypothetical protein